MRLIRFKVVLLLLCLGPVFGESFWWEKAKAPQLTKANFDEFVGKDKYVFVEFYSKSCINCEQLLPALNKIFDDNESGALKRKDILVMKANGDQMSKLCDELDIDSFPTMVLYKPGEKKYPETYNFNHKYQEMKEYLMSLVPAPKFVPVGSIELKISA